jgi:acetylglutamate kinase
MKILVKLGGTLLDDGASRQRLACELTRLHSEYRETVVVHGGGKQMTRFLAERGVASQFVNGLRVSTPEVIDAVLKVFAGTVNHELVAALGAAGARAVGLSGIDARLVEAEPLGGEYGAVGRPVRSNPQVIEALWQGGLLPVVACVAVGSGGQVLNVNADQMAVACAAGMGADRLYFLTDVEGVRGAQGQHLSSLNGAEMRELIAAGVATGGMQAKLEAAMLALRQGVREVVIAPGARPEVLRALLAGEPAGTRLVAGESGRD